MVKKSPNQTNSLHKKTPIIHPLMTPKSENKMAATNNAMFLHGQKKTNK